MKNLRWSLWAFGLIPTFLTPLLVISCSNTSIVKDKPDKDKPDPDKQKHNFLKEIVDETWENIDVNVKTFDEWLQVKKMYEQKIIELNNQNNVILNNDKTKYYQNLFYISWYLRIIGKANKNLSWLKFASLHGNIFENDDKNVNFTYALYWQNRMGYLWSTEISKKIKDFYFQEMVQYQPGDMLENNFLIPKNYLNFGTYIIKSEELQIFVNNYINQQNKQNLSKVINYFANKQDSLIFQSIIDQNDKSLEQRWSARIWTSHPFVTDHTYLDWLASKDIFRPFGNEISFNQINWKEWIDFEV